jgi:hypothetical protein
LKLVPPLGLPEAGGRRFFFIEIREVLLAF